jgi:hypothetical protein
MDMGVASRWSEAMGLAPNEGVGKSLRHKQKARQANPAGLILLRSKSPA